MDGVVPRLWGQVASKQGGVPSRHNTMSGQGPVMPVFEMVRMMILEPAKIGERSLAVLYEQCLMVGVTEEGLQKCQKVPED